MNIYILFASVLILCVGALILKELKSSLIPVISSIFCVILCVQAVITVIPVISYLKSLENNWRILGEYVPYMMKAVGISFIGTLATELCKECGLSSAVFGIDLTLKAMLLSLALPMMITITETITQMISL